MLTESGRNRTSKQDEIIGLWKGVSDKDICPYFPYFLT